MYVIFFLIAVLEVPSTVDSVVVYNDRAMVTRVAQVNLDAPVNLVFADLPGAIDDGSVRLKVSGVTIGEVQVKRGYREEHHPRVEELQVGIDRLQIRDRLLIDESAVLKDKEKFLQTIAVAGPEVASRELLVGKVSPESWSSGLRFMVEELMHVKRRQAEIERERKNLQEEINALRREMDDIRAVVENRKAVIFDVHPSEAKKYRIELSYIISGAGWRTYYELRAQPSMGTVKIAYYAKVSQRTGEDWDNTRIVLSTAQPALAGTVPGVDPWYITLYAPQPKEKVVYAEREAIILSAERGVLPEPPPQPVDVGISIWYPLPGRHTIKTGEPEKKVKIKDATVNGAFEYFIVPRRREAAFSTGHVLNSTDYLFLSGEAGTYMGDDFTGTMYLATTAPEESATVFFGVDERVKVQRELKKSKVSKGGLFSKTTKYEYTYKNTISNYHNKDIQCTIIDQIPVAQSADIKLSGISFEPRPSEEDKDRGIYYWKTPVDPGKEFTITINFTVETPADKEVIGLMP